MQKQSPAPEDSPKAPAKGFGPEDIHITPFKLKRDRPSMPFKRGMGVTLAGWQFEIAHFLPNGNVVLKPKGKVIK